MIMGNGYSSRDLYFSVILNVFKSVTGIMLTKASSVIRDNHISGLCNNKGFKGLFS